MSDELRTAFIAEARDLLADMELALLRCEDGTADGQTINEIFRAAHTIKGSAGVVGLDGVVGFTHVVETVLDRVRAGTLELHADTAALLIGCKDHILALIDAAASGADMQTPEHIGAGATLTARLHGLLEDEPPPPAAQVPVSAPRTIAPPKIAPPSRQAQHDPPADSPTWHISVRFSAEVLQCGMDPLSIIRHLGTFGQLVSVEVVDDGLPAADEFDAAVCYVGFEISFATTADKEQIEAAFEFVDACHLHIIPPRSLMSSYLELLAGAPEGNVALGELLMRCGTLTRRELDSALLLQRQLISDLLSDPPQLGEILIQQQLVAPRVVEAALARQQRTPDPSRPPAPISGKPEGHSIRVDSAKLEKLTDLIGELIIAGASTDLLARRADLADLNESTSRLSRLVEAVRDQTLELRMVQIGSTFTRFQRVVRDVARELGKEIRLEISGGDTELDKTLVEHMNDPLMHLVRNAIDHGIEDAASRMVQGKSAQGTLRLAAYHDSGAVIIEVSDDGRGLDRERILRKARERGLIATAAALSDEQTLALIFEPGFSTTDAVTQLSGRGVGMDVVRSNVAALRGTVDLVSVEGHGTTVRIRLPLTLAIIEGFRVRVGNSSFIIPLDMVEECVDLSPADAAAANQLIDLRGKLLPFVRLRDLYPIEGDLPKWESIVVVRGVGFVVDELLGELQTVIKPLPKLFGNVKGIGGSTILGSGQIALILDVPTLVQQCLVERNAPKTTRRKTA
jgi:two-component system chemotaxis sensor kinase CheA